jgi:radical SAM protein (TIGR04043 family)
MLDLFMDLAALQSQGARTESDRDQGRRGGAGPSDDRAFKLGGHTIMIPTRNRPARGSAFAIVGGCDGLSLQREGRVLGALEPIARPRFYDLATADGISYEKIARLHGSDCLATTVVQECIRYDDPATRCRFCAIGVSLKDGSTIHTKTPRQLAEVARAAQELDGVTHVTLTSGTMAGPDRGALYLGECAAAIKHATGLPVQAQFEPPADPGVFAALKQAGVDDVGLHVESFDPGVRARVTPGKAVISIPEYLEAFAAAVRVFGRGKVSTYVVLGLGEDERLTLDGCRRAIALGVYPFVVPLRPLLNTALAKAEPPPAEYTERVYSAVAAMLAAAGLSSRDSSAGCVKCRACSLLQLRECA